MTSGSNNRMTGRCKLTFAGVCCYCFLHGRGRGSCSSMFVRDNCGNLNTFNSIRGMPNIGLKTRIKKIYHKPKMHKQNDLVHRISLLLLATEIDV